jgi:hypothetical protein
MHPFVSQVSWDSIRLLLTQALPIRRRPKQFLAFGVLQLQSIVEGKTQKAKSPRKVVELVEHVHWKKQQKIIRARQ